MNFLLGLLVAVLSFLVANGAYTFLTRTKPHPINRNERPNAGLLIIDMQEDFTRSGGRTGHDPAKLEKAVALIDALAADAHARGIPVIEISHAFTDPFEKLAVKLIANGRGNEGSEGLGRDPALTFEADHHVWKHHPDSFTANALETLLKELRIGHLYLAGQDASACINATARAALKRQYGVTLLDDAILARNQSKWQKQRHALLTDNAQFADSLA